MIIQGWEEQKQVVIKHKTIRYFALEVDRM